MARRKDQSKHEYIIKSFVGVLKSNQYKDIKADIDGYDKPNKLYWEGSEKGYTPDITAIFDKVYHSPERFIFEVETEDSIDDSHTEDKWKLFGTYGNSFRRRFIVIVPKDCKQKALVIAEQIDVKLWDVWTLDS